MTRAGKVLHLLSQRPQLTGSGITLDAMVRHAARAGWEQRVSVGVPYDDPAPPVGGLPSGQVDPLFFETGELGFPVPGMSDVMPYRSTRFSSMSAEQVATYVSAWRAHISRIAASFRPDVVHSHHVWLMSSVLREIFPKTPIVLQCHGTALRQMQICAPELGRQARAGCSQADLFLVLHEGHAEALARALSIPARKIRVVGAGYAEDVFHARGRKPGPGAPALLYAGKYAHAKGLPQLLDAVERLGRVHDGITLHVAGSGAGPEADALSRRMRAMAPRVVLHGQVGQERLAELMRSSAVFVLPSYYEGLPLVLVEALACGCRLVSTDLPGVRSGLLPHLEAVLARVPLPHLRGVDEPEPADLPAFVDGLCEAIDSALRAPPLGDPKETMPEVVEAFTWQAVFTRVEAAWRGIG